MCSLVFLGCCCGPVAAMSLSVGLPATFIGWSDLRSMKSGTMDPAGSSKTRTGMIMGLVSSCIAIGLPLIFIAFVVWMNAMGGVN